MILTPRLYIHNSTLWCPKFYYGIPSVLLFIPKAMGESFKVLKDHSRGQGSKVLMTVTGKAADTPLLTSPVSLLCHTLVCSSHAKVLAIPRICNITSHECVLKLFPLPRTLASPPVTQLNPIFPQFSSQ